MLERTQSVSFNGPIDSSARSYLVGRAVEQPFSFRSKEIDDNLCSLQCDVYVMSNVNSLDNHQDKYMR